MTAVADATGQVNHYVGIFSDISEQKAQVDRLQRLAHHDPLTELPNRALFYDRLSQAIVQARRDERRIAVMFIDLDYFKVINDEHGHDVGDRLLCGVADRLSGCVRESDTVARLGGDEFTAILTDIANPSGVAIFAEACFGHPSPSKRQILNATVYAYGAPTSCVRCVITSSRLYTTPSLTLRRHKAAAASSPSFAHASTTNMQTASTIGTNRPHFALHGGQRKPHQPLPRRCLLH
ncbi:GGDEF domain-containing protein [Candidatus Reidiella endopervernicosa]|uniref:GGDEF domain-containing protein n=1 Tax=Candidatus Reidiella endopervernicosa TaxID=2738883 RepID=A0A6N0I0P8_9GAMM|nr:GGDEF domain-containing protein [Candidatus Reidiella endopervernicosa]